VTVPANTNVKIRLKAQLLKTGFPSWDFQVVDNTNSKSPYAADSGILNSGADNISGKNLHAPSGWSSTSYTSARSAAPFAILDVVYQALDKITAANPAVTMPQLLINWSINNIAVSGDKSLGQITTSHYDSAEHQLYILGQENNDTDEYDDHVIAHEWGHYFEYRLSRSDSMGGMHVIGDKLDPRIAFSEGFGNAVSGMITDDPYYIDTFGVSQANTGLFIDLEDNNFAESSEGWFSEASVWAILYDLYDSNDSVALGFAPLYDVLVNKQKNASSFTTTFSFISFLKENNPGMIAGINSLVAGENISTAFIDEWDSTGTETNSGGSAKALPVYIRLTTGGIPEELCSSGFHGNYNKLMNRRFFYFQVHSSGNYTITAVPDFNGDPVIRLYSKGSLIASADSGGNGITEILQASLSPGYYAGEIYEYEHVHNTYQTEECFEVMLN